MDYRRTNHQGWSQKGIEVSSGQRKKHHGWKSRRMIIRDGMVVLLNKDGSERERRPMEKKNEKR